MNLLCGEKGRNSEQKVMNSVEKLREDLYLQEEDGTWTKRNHIVQFLSK